MAYKINRKGVRKVNPSSDKTIKALVAAMLKIDPEIAVRIMGLNDIQIEKNGVKVFASLESLREALANSGEATDAILQHYAQAYISSLTPKSNQIDFDSVYPMINTQNFEPGSLLRRRLSAELCQIE